MSDTGVGKQVRNDETIRDLRARRLDRISPDDVNVLAAEIDALRAEVETLNEEFAREVDAKCVVILALDEARASLAASRASVLHEERARKEAEAECARLREEGAALRAEWNVVCTCGATRRQHFGNAMCGYFTPAPAPSPGDTYTVPASEIDAAAARLRAPSPKEDAPRCEACESINDRCGDDGGTYRCPKHRTVKCLACNGRGFVRAPTGTTGCLACGGTGRSPSTERKDKP